MTTETKPWAAPGLSVEERAHETVENYPYNDERLAAVMVAEALHAARADALEAAALIVLEETGGRGGARGGWQAAHRIRARKDKP